MSQFALLIQGALQEFRHYDEKPMDIPHKGVSWHPVLHENGEPFEGLENGVWVVRTMDPANLPPPVPEFITRRQCALELYARQIITLEEALAMTKTAEVPVAIAQVFDAAVTNGQMTAEQRMLAEIDFAAINYYRANSLLGFMGLTDPQIDEFFVAAALR